MLILYQLAQYLVLRLQVDNIGQAFDAVEKILFVQGFDGVIVCTCPHRLDRRIYRSVGGHHQEYGIYALVASFFDHLDTADIRQANVANGNIDVTLAEAL